MMRRLGIMAISLILNGFLLPLAETERERFQQDFLLTLKCKLIEMKLILISLNLVAVSTHSQDTLIKLAYQSMCGLIILASFGTSLIAGCRC